MDLEVSFEPGIPLRRQLEDVLRVAIRSGRLGPGSLLPPSRDDVEYRFGREPVASMQGLAPDRVAFVGTTSKTLAPALRLAWMVPPAGLLDEAERVIMVTGVTPPTLDQLALATFIGDAALERHLRSMRRRYAAKRDILVDAGRSAPSPIRFGHVVRDRCHAGAVGSAAHHRRSRPARRWPRAVQARDAEQSRHADENPGAFPLKCVNE